MMFNCQASLLENAAQEPSPAEALLPSRAGDRIKRDLAFLLEFNRDLNRNAHLSRLNEKYLERKMEEIDAHVPICETLYECTRVRLHELLLLCAANYANNCEYGALGDLMFNPRLILVHISGFHQPVVKERHRPLAEQFQDRAASPFGVRVWIRNETTLEIKKKPLVPHSYENIERASSISKAYLDSTRERGVQIADLSAFLCSMGFQDRLDLEDWLRRAEARDRDLVEAKLLCLDWEIFRGLGGFLDVMLGHAIEPSSFPHFPAAIPFSSASLP